MTMTREQIIAEVKGTLETWFLDSHTVGWLGARQHYIAGLLNAPEDPDTSLTIEVRENRREGGEPWLITIDARRVSP